MNKEFYFNSDGTLNAETAGHEIWLRYLTDTSYSYVNKERLERMVDFSGHETVDYVMRSLDILDEIRSDVQKSPVRGEIHSDARKDPVRDEIHSVAREGLIRDEVRKDTAEGLTDEEYYLIRTTLQWAETAKGGTSEQRRIWQEKGYALDIHNLGSAEIFREHHDLRGTDNRVIYTLIRTHGLLGQSLRGEVALAESRELADLTSCMPEESLTRILCVLNHCIIGAVSPQLWEKVREAVLERISLVVDGTIREMSPSDRMHALLPSLAEEAPLLETFLAESVFPCYQLWYFESALATFGSAQVLEILSQVVQRAAGKQVQHLNFKPLADSLYYDYKDHRHVNIYRKRIIEKYLRDNSVQNVRLDTWDVNGILYVNFAFTPVCSHLIDFCVEAERSGMLTYEKSIIVLFDMFGFRRDEFDRLNNEDSYLETMNAVEMSTKDSIIDYVTGGSAVDVGSGGGVLLDRLETRYPELKITGTDISENVIETLMKKKAEEGHRWSVLKHNFAEGALPFLTDNVIFSSILHEIYSYQDGPNGRFDLENVKNALKHAADSLRPGGRIIIRDGVKTEGEDELQIHFLNEEGMEFFRNYQADFGGLKDIPEEARVTFEDPVAHIVRGNINFMREFLYTYTWGQESYPHEVQEQFGYMTLSEYKEYLESLGLSLIFSRSLLESGYEEHLSRDVELTDGRGNPAAYPDSNLIIVAQKQ